MRMSKSSRIFQAAVDVFSEKGFDKATMDDIATRANVAKGTIYYHFKSKEDLFLFLVQEGMELLKEAVQKKITPEMSGKEKIAVTIHEQLAFFSVYKDFCIILLREAWGEHERQKRFRRLLRDYTKYIESFIRQGMEEKEFQVGDPEMVAWAIFGSLSIPALHVILGGQTIDVEKMEELLHPFIFQGLTRFS
ncbi:TetR family transcriptional regulator [Collibacillus ludicampi]|uniref:TetR family transcriptional regulator n=2 Tax=Collibacillus ludicampi TaxID=2771369 RepID=A0AAV4LHJ7_9BACL|nr:TetR family transcriptional regulator [Collibacillus ludicampi]